MNPLNLYSGHTVLRCDRQSHNNKGGVLISVDPSVKVCHTVLNNSGNIECILTILQLPNMSHIVVILIYRPPSSTIDALLNVAVNYSSSFALPTFIMGDFNIDLLSQNFDRRLINLLCVNNFTQMVKSPTTDRGSLIDHVYTANSYQFRIIIIYCHDGTIPDIMKMTAMIIINNDTVLFI